MDTAHNDASRPSPAQPWLRALSFAAPITALVLFLMVRWFTLNNRYVTFLYHHDMGPRVPDTRPFSPVTRSRYWMTGLVAAGAIGILVAGVHFILGRLSRRYRAPDWWRVWMLCAGPLAIGIPAITMISNSPTLPFWLASLTASATLAGLALALLPGRVVAERPMEAAFLGLDGLCLALWLLTLPGLEYVPEWIAGGRRLWLLMLVLLPLAGLAGLAILTILRSALGVARPTAWKLSLAALIVTYIILPIVHHIAFTGGLYYISDMDNFFARDLGIQALTFAATAAVIWATVRARRAAFRK